MNKQKHMEKQELLGSHGLNVATRRQAKSQAAAALLACPNLEEYLPLPERRLFDKSQGGNDILVVPYWAYVFFVFTPGGKKLNGNCSLRIFALGWRFH